MSVCRLAGFSVVSLNRQGVHYPPFARLKPAFSAVIRTVFSQTGVWERDYKAETRHKVESWWHSRIQDQWQKDMKEQVSYKYNKKYNKEKNVLEKPEWHRVAC